MSVRPDRLEPGDFPVAFGRYTLLRLLGEGGMARVFEAELVGHEGFRKRSAMKVIRSGIGRNEARLRKALIKEARLGGLLHHPNVVETYDFGETEGQAWIAMEVVRGMGLDQLLSEGTALPPAIAIEVASQICQGLEHAHHLESDGQPTPLVHRDLKPSNVMIAHSGLVKVLDFGIAKATHISGHTTETGMTKGTPAYMSPEQAAGDPVDARSDLFAAGCILFELVTGRRFFRGETVYSIMLQVIKVDELVSDPATLAPAEAVVPGITKILRKCLARDVSKRWASARDMERAMRKLQGNLPLPGPIRDWLELREEAYRARTAELEALSLDKTPGFEGFARPRRIEELAATEPLTPSLSQLPAQTGRLAPSGPAALSAAADVGAHRPRTASPLPPPPPAEPPVRAAEPPPGPTRTMDVQSVRPAPRSRLPWVITGIAVVLLLIAGAALLRGERTVEPLAPPDGLPETEVVSTAEDAATAQPAPDPTPQPTAVPDPTPSPAPRAEPTPAPIAARPEPTPAPRAHRPTAAIVAGRIEHTPPTQAVVGAPNRVSARVVDADCTPAVLYGPWSASDGDLVAKVMSGSGDGHFEAELFIPYELAWRNGFRYVIRCGGRGEPEVRWPASGTKRVDALAR